MTIGRHCVCRSTPDLPGYSVLVEAVDDDGLNLLAGLRPADVISNYTVVNDAGAQAGAVGAGIAISAVASCVQSASTRCKVGRKSQYPALQFKLLMKIRFDDVEGWPFANIDATGRTPVHCCDRLA